jgi:hypothetical protein
MTDPAATAHPPVSDDQAHEVALVAARTAQEVAGLARLQLEPAAAAAAVVEAYLAARRALTATA